MHLAYAAPVSGIGLAVHGGAGGRGRIEPVSAQEADWPAIVGRQGHSICYCRLMHDGREEVVKYANSWGVDWGDNGFDYDSMRQFRKSSGRAYALRSVRLLEAA